MADYPSWDKLNKKQRRLALAKWREREDARPATPQEKRQAYLDEPAVAGVPGLTRRDLRRDTRTAAMLKYGEAAQQLQRQPARINDWFDQYKQAIAQARNAAVGNDPNQIGGYYGAAAQGVENLQTGLNQAAKEQWAGQQQAMAADAAQRGATVDPTLAEQAKNAAGVRGTLTAGVGATILGQGANEASYLGRRRANAELGRVGVLRQNAQARTDLAKERGAFKSDYRTQAKAEAIKNYLSQSVAADLMSDRAADNARANAALEIGDANSDATRTATNRRFRQGGNHYGYTNGQWARMTPAERLTAKKQWDATDDKGKDKADKWGTQAQQNSARDSISYGVSAAKRLKAAGATRAEAAEILLAGQSPQSIDGKKVPGINKVPKDYASVALDVAYNGYITSPNVKTLRKRGIRVKPLGYSLTAPPKPDPVSVTDVAWD